MASVLFRENDAARVAPTGLLCRSRISEGSGFLYLLGFITGSLWNVKIVGDMWNVIIDVEGIEGPTRRFLGQKQQSIRFEEVDIEECRIGSIFREGRIVSKDGRKIFLARQTIGKSKQEDILSQLKERHVILER